MTLFEGEKINFPGKEELIAQTLSMEEISDKYIRGEVRIITEQARYPLNTIMTMLTSGDYNLNPEFQRRKRWNPTKQSRLIESFIMNVPIYYECTDSSYFSI
jgi:uncharacterized protein with ParB-like and HNH nuclease domain